MDGVTEDGFEDEADFNITQFQANMEDKLNDIVEEYTKIAEEWKTGLMNQYLLNEDVSIYDWSQGESRCIGPVHIRSSQAIFGQFGTVNLSAFFETACRILV